MNRKPYFWHLTTTEYQKLIKDNNLKKIKSLQLSKSNQIYLNNLKF